MTARLSSLRWPINTGGQLAASLGGPFYGAMLDRGRGFGAVWGTAGALGALRVGAVLALREPRSPSGGWER